MFVAEPQFAKRILSLGNHLGQAWEAHPLDRLIFVGIPGALVGLYKFTFLS
jgi:hypothetical protein